MRGSGGASKVKRQFPCSKHPTAPGSPYNNTNNDDDDDDDDDSSRDRRTDRPRLGSPSRGGRALPAHRA